MNRSRDEMIDVATRALKGVMEYEDDEDPECLATVVVDALFASNLEQRPELFKVDSVHTHPPTDDELHQVADQIAARRGQVTTDEH